MQKETGEECKVNLGKLKKVYFEFPIKCLVTDDFPFSAYFASIPL